MLNRERQSADSQKHHAKSHRHSSDHSARRESSSTQTNHGSSDKQRRPRTESDNSGGLLSRFTGGIVSMIGGRSSETETCEGCGDCEPQYLASHEHSSASTRDQQTDDAGFQSKELAVAQSNFATMKSKNDSLTSDLAAANKKIRDLRARLERMGDQPRLVDVERLQEQVRHQERDFESRLAQEGKELERRYATAMQTLEQENYRLRQNEASLKDQLSSRQSPISLDPFYNQVDQISEAQIIRDGNPTLNGINGAIDDFVSELLEEAGSMGRPNPTSPPSQELRFNHSLLNLLQSQNMTDEKAGYIIDAALHDFLVTLLVDAFFARPVTHCPNSEHWLPHIDKLFHGIIAEEKWSVSQRWRSVATTNIARNCSPVCCDTFQAHVESEILKFLSWAFVIPASALDGLQAKLNNELESISWDAHQLSTLMKRDFLSARLTVVAAPVDRNTQKYLKLHNDWSVSVWPGMGAQQGDAVIGSYKLGLDSLAEKGKIKHLVKPEVITVALIRTVQQ